jgi:ribosome-associated protein
LNLPYDEIEISAMRSRGPGGQNVNKTNSAIQLRWNLRNSLFFAPYLHSRLMRKLGSKLTLAGEIILRCDSSRDQETNKKDAYKKLFDIIEQASIVPKARIKTKPTKGSKQRRLTSKTKRSETKKLRSKKIE